MRRRDDSGEVRGVIGLPMFEQPPDPPHPTFNLSEGSALRDAALNGFEACKPIILATIRKAMRDRCASGAEYVTPDDVRQYLHDTMPGWEDFGDSQCWLAGVFRGKCWRQVGTVRSAHVRNHARMIGCYVYVPEE